MFRAKRGEDDERPVSVQLSDKMAFDHISVPRSEFGAAPWLFGTDIDRSLIDKIDINKTSAGKVLAMGQGMQTGLNGVFGGHPPSVVNDWDLPDEAWFVRARNSDVRRWMIRDSGELLIYPNAYSRIADLPKEMRKYLQQHKAELEKRAAYRRGNCEWWQYTWPLHAERYIGPRILCPYLAIENHVALDEGQRFLGLTDTTVIFPTGTPENFRYFLALLNSKILTRRFRFIGKLKSSGIRENFHNSIAKIPLHRIDWKSQEERGLHDALVKQASRLEELVSGAAAKAKQTATNLSAIATVERKIDDAVCELYGLTSTDYEQISNDLLGDKAKAVASRKGESLMAED